jgi:hypothetical protein
MGGMDREAAERAALDDVAAWLMAQV